MSSSPELEELVLSGVSIVQLSLLTSKLKRRTSFGIMISKLSRWSQSHRCHQLANSRWSHSQRCHQLELTPPPVSPSMWIMETCGIAVFSLNRRRGIAPCHIGRGAASPISGRCTIASRLIGRRDHHIISVEVAMRGHRLDIVAGSSQ